ncbi:MAG: hypothetical protein SFU27_06420 [Thermonemataceae bacterium]|nr:hypothetical protein [Thermonemataceae bacterium]
MQDLYNKIKTLAELKKQDVNYFENRGYALYAMQYARRAAYMRLFSMPATYLKKEFGLPKRQLMELAIPFLEKEGIRIKNLQYLQKLTIAYKRKGLDTCISGKIRNTNALKADQEHVSLITGLMTGVKKPTVAEITSIYNDFVAKKMELVNEATGEQPDGAKFKPLSYSTISKKIAAPLNRAAYSATHSSELSYKIKHAFHIKRKRPSYAGSMVTCDDWDMNINIQIGKHKKAYAYLFFDVATRHCVGYAWSFEKNKDLFMSGLRNMLANPIWDGKTPYEIQGESNLLKGMNEDILKQIFPSTKIIPKNPLGKYAERDIRDLKYRVFARNTQYKDYFKGRHYNSSEAWTLDRDQQAAVKVMQSKEEIDNFLRTIVAEYNQVFAFNKPLHEKLPTKNTERLAFFVGEKALSPTGKPITYANGCFTYKKQVYAFTEIDKLKSKYLDVRFWESVPYVFQNDEYIGKGESFGLVPAATLEKQDYEDEEYLKQFAIAAKLQNQVAEHLECIEKVSINKYFEKPPEKTPTSKDNALTQLTGDDFYTNLNF